MKQPEWTHIGYEILIQFVSEIGNLNRAIAYYNSFLELPPNPAGINRTS